MDEIQQHTPVIHSFRQSQRRPYSIGTLRSKKTDEVKTPQLFELRPISNQYVIKTQKLRKNGTIKRERKIIYTVPMSLEKPRSLQEYVREKIQSEIYPEIQFTKKSLRSTLSQIHFDSDIKALGPYNKKNEIVYEIIREIFQEINIHSQSILVCQHNISKHFFVYFSDCDLVPISKCCNSIIYIEISKYNHGRIICNNMRLIGGILSAFSLLEDEERILWTEDPVWDQIHDLQKISNLIATGRFRKRSLSKEVQKAYQKKNTSARNKAISQHQENENENQESFKKSRRSSMNKPIKIQNQYKLSLVENLILNGKIFNKNFDDIGKNFANSIEQIEDFIKSDGG